MASKKHVYTSKEVLQMVQELEPESDVESDAISELELDSDNIIEDESDENEDEDENSQVFEGKDGSGWKKISINEHKRGRVSEGNIFKQRPGICSMSKTRIGSAIDVGNCYLQNKC